MDKICKNCKFYRPHKKEVYGQCKKLKIINGDTINPNQYAATDDFILLFLGSGFWEVDKFVGENFGCVHWEK